MAAQKKVAVIIPCYNEAASIAQVIAKFPRKKLEQNALHIEIYVVDNNSADNTAAIARKAGAHVLHEPKQGKGNALRTGFRSLPSDIDYVVMLDGDDTYSPAEILRILEPLKSDFCDVVIGSRLGGRIQATAMSRFNLLGNRVFTAIVRGLYGANVTDVLTGYFAWKKSALDALEPHIASQGFAIEMEMITKMARMGHHMTSVPISYDPRAGESHLHPLRDGLRILSMLLKNLVWRPRKLVDAAYTPGSLPSITADPFIPRRIVFVSDTVYPYMKGGKEKRLHEITKRLAAMGHEVHIYTMHWWSGPEKTKIENGVHLHALCKYYDLYRGNQRTVKEGVIFGLACFKLFRERLDDTLDVDHMPFFPVFSTWIVCTLRRRKLYATWHESLSTREWVAYMGLGGIIAAFIEHLSTMLPYRITAASGHTRELLALNHGRTKRVELVGSGIDTPLLRSVQPVPYICDVLFAGRLVKDKNVDKLVLAIATLARWNPNIRCIIIGGGPEKSRLQRLAARRRLQKNITFLDPLPEATDLYAYMKAAKVFCSPSVREGFGIAALEALGCGTPVIAIDSPSNAARHLVQDGKNGSIVPLSPAALATAILHWTSSVSKPDIAPQTDNYDWQNLAREQAKVYAL